MENKPRNLNQILSSHISGFHQYCLFAMDRRLHLPVWSMYLLLPILMVLILPFLEALIKRIPVLKTRILGK